MIPLCFPGIHHNYSRYSPGVPTGNQPLTHQNPWKDLYASLPWRKETNQVCFSLAMSPIGDAFRNRLRMFPSLINCCTIDWFQSWPTDALELVANKFLEDVELDDNIRIEYALAAFQYPNQIFQIGNPDIGCIVIIVLRFLNFYIENHIQLDV